MVVASTRKYTIILQVYILVLCITSYIYHFCKYIYNGRPRLSPLFLPTGRGPQPAVWTSKWLRFILTAAARVRCPTVPGL